MKEKKKILRLLESNKTLWATAQALLLLTVDIEKLRRILEPM